jgi:hypothetical protein
LPENGRDRVRVGFLTFRRVAVLYPQERAEVFGAVIGRRDREVS